MTHSWHCFEREDIWEQKHNLYTNSKTFSKRQYIVCFDGQNIYLYDQCFVRRRPTVLTLDGFTWKIKYCVTRGFNLHLIRQSVQVKTDQGEGCSSQPCPNNLEKKVIKFNQLVWSEQVIKVIGGIGRLKAQPLGMFMTNDNLSTHILLSSQWSVITMDKYSCTYLSDQVRWNW